MDREKIVEFIKEEFKTGNIRNKLFPMMTKFGVRDYSETVHTVGLNYITAIGRFIDGVTSLSECPVFPYSEKSHYGEMVAESQASYGIKVNEVRPDSIWYSKEDNSPILICEFERYEKNRRKDLKIKEKIQNLLLAYHQLGENVPIILFVYWSYAGKNPGDIDEYISILDKGFKKNDGIYIQGINTFKTTYLVYRCVASGNIDNLTLNQWVEVG
ncbi:hypothetical protein CN13_09195 [Petrotoga sp. HKA.pet.4.5]|uniref:hypothetical protein n=1 Tax=unclassified Petrotoga TaxID=2620614 RepID=UPI000EF17595|nr:MULTISPECIES: hypothetical protein [unclassified Petrotoga]RLL86346.1 hypothetical protein BZ25_01560 [Petrotoga sp. Shatin.DS.tank11.9.2.9.3]RLL88017.1 hypothetical protein CN13_09195 [Petrotoga sp. HKA.pet.4.5]